MLYALDRKQVKETCIIIQSAEMNSMDWFSGNDVYIGVYADEYVRRDTKLIQDTNYPVFNETFCYIGEIIAFSFDVFEQDSFGILGVDFGVTNTQLVGNAELYFNRDGLHVLDIVNGKQDIIGKLRVIINRIYVKDSDDTEEDTIFEPTNSPTMNMIADEYLTKLELYNDGFVLLGRGQCRDEKDRMPSYFNRILDPRLMKMDDVHGYCRNKCRDIDECLGYLYHIAGELKHACILYMEVGGIKMDDHDGKWQAFDMGYNSSEINHVKPFKDGKIFGYCFVKMS